MAQAAQMFNDYEITLTAGATLNPYVRVKINSSGEAVAAGLTDTAVGYLTHRGATSGEPCTVRVINAPSHAAVAAGAFAVGALLYSAADGEVDDADGGSAVIVGYALDASGADQDVVRILPSA